jgi:protein-S-isoprenylcysteine O-methyltransferase Ste14
MMRSEMIRAAGLYFPVSAACVAGALRGRGPRTFAACLLGVLWTAPSLLLVQKLNLVFGWWTFDNGDVSFSSMPLELYIGWVIAWGIVPQIALRRFSLWISILSMTVLDLAVMPCCAPVVKLGRAWLLGEAVNLLLVLMPALCIARWTMENKYLQLRAWMQIAISGGVFLFLLPEILFSAHSGPRSGSGWTPLLETAGRQRQVAVQLLLLIALPGIGAVMEFAERGGGTPIPFDPPVRLVTSGIYRYCANPMQLCCTLVLVAWAAVLRNSWLLLIPLTCVVYSAGIARWDEGEDMDSRFGESWRRYRAHVRDWIPRWRPHHVGNPAQLYMAAGCAPCSELWRWIAVRRPVGLEILAAESLARGSIRRMRYVPEDGSQCVEGVRAMGRALEHLNLAWAVAGIGLRVPGIWRFVQVVMDASGLGPRVPDASFGQRATDVGER